MQTLEAMNVHLTNQEKEAFEQLKSRIENKYGLKQAQDYQLYRFLKARNFVANKAEEMLDKHLEWRRQNSIDTILETYKESEVLKNYFQYNAMGYDIEGHLNIYAKIGTVDSKGILKSEKLSNIFLYTAYFLTGCEKLLKEQSEKLGKPIETWNVILDMENLPFSQVLHKPTIDSFLGALSVHETNYPERLKSAIVINASKPFFILYNIMKQVLAPSTKQKVKFFGTEGWKEEFLKFIHPDELPAFLGGNKTDPDGNPMCRTIINHGGIVPEKYYFKNTEKKLFELDDVQVCDLNRMGKAEILIEVTEPESSIEWEFGTKSNDVAFGISYKRKHESKMKPITLIETVRVDCHLQVEAGTFHCKKAGIYILTLDNSYSWFRQKRVYYRTSVIPPKTDWC